ncbi:PaaI family thioesterase [Saccharopolyspora sp. MS10]|uniref:PaaI family thioesterase n=1 Tax=Saccharopolyspora sp. MS10 TaxID=3385973 RepID=UPI0039A1429F
MRELGAALRALTGAATRTEVDVATLRKIANQARELAEPLGEATRTRRTPPSVDEARPGRRMYNPVVGPGNPIAPPLEVRVEGGVAVGRCTLGLSYEGPHSYVHGGVSAMLLDQILGHAHAARGRPGLTASLSLRYRRPVPLETPLLLTAWVPEESATDRRTGPKATIATEEDPGTALVEATGIFVVPNAEQVARIFGDSRPSWSKP